MATKRTNRKPNLSLGDPADDAPPPRRPADTEPDSAQENAHAAEPDQDAEEDEYAERKAVSVYLPVVLANRARGLVGSSQLYNQPPGYSSLAELYTEALEDKLQELEDEYNDGKQYPAPLGGLSRGPGGAGAKRVSKKAIQRGQDRRSNRGK